MENSLRHKTDEEIDRWIQFFQNAHSKMGNKLDKYIAEKQRREALTQPTLFEV